MLIALINFKSRNYHVVAYNISILAEGLHFSALVIIRLYNTVGEENRVYSERSE